MSLAPTLLFTILELNQITARVDVRVDLTSSGSAAINATVLVKAYEVGADGSQPDVPLALTPPIGVTVPVAGKIATHLTLPIGTPFYSSETNPFTYAIRLTLVADHETTAYETHISLSTPEAGGRIVIRRPTAKIPLATGRNNRALPSLFVISDSTACARGPNQLGWGEPLADFFDLAKVNVLNWARAGRSSRSFRNEGLWDRALEEMKPGDIVLIQFGHNDADKLAEGRCRGVLPGIGPDKQEVTLPRGTKDTVHTYGWYLRQMISDVRAHGASPVLLSLTAKNQWRDGRLDRGRDDYGRWAAAVAVAEEVPFIDLTRKIAERYDALGQDAVQALFCSAHDNVHTSPAGARLNATCVVAGLKSLSDQWMPAAVRP